MDEVERKCLSRHLDFKKELIVGKGKRLVADQEAFRLALLNEIMSCFGDFLEQDVC